MGPRRRHHFTYLAPAAVLERGHVYLIPLLEVLALPPYLRGKTNPKSSTGRLDIFTRVITDAHARFDDIRPGYHGDLFDRILISQAQLLPDRLSAVGRADTAPVASNDSEEGRLQNRRIEIILLPPEGQSGSIS